MPGLGIRVVPLGAGQDVGRSCILVSIKGMNVMLDCGVHMGHTDHRRIPDFSYISRSGKFDELIDCVIISHFHLDHVGALPYFTEVCKYNGPIYMTYPTRAICPILLEDMRRVMVDKKGDTQYFSSDDIRNCMRKVTPIDLNQSICVKGKMTIKAYQAGHVIGAAMFFIQVGQESVLYTGDYNMTPDRHLGAARIERLRPSLLITETTYATIVRKSRRARERELLQQIHECVKRGGKALIPVFALGRVQELCILIEDYWDKNDDLRGTVPVYFSAGLAEHATRYYSLFINWTNDRIKRASIDRNVFNFEHIKVYQPRFVDDKGPMVLFASPGMLHAGTPFEVFKKWCGNPKNMVILPGYCVAGTIGARVLAGQTEIEVDRFTTLNVRLAVKNLFFSAHADSKGIMQLIKICDPKCVMLVHGEASKMSQLKNRIKNELNIPCIDPANGETVFIDTPGDALCTLDLPLARYLWRKAFQERDKIQQVAIMKTDFMPHKSQSISEVNKKLKFSNFTQSKERNKPLRYNDFGKDLISKIQLNHSIDLTGVIHYYLPPTIQQQELDAKMFKNTFLLNGGQGAVRILPFSALTAKSSSSVGLQPKFNIKSEFHCLIKDTSTFYKSIKKNKFKPSKVPHKYEKILIVNQFQSDAVNKEQCLNNSDALDSTIPINAENNELNSIPNISENDILSKIKLHSLNEISISVTVSYPELSVWRDASDYSVCISRPKLEETVLKTLINCEKQEVLSESLPPFDSLPITRVSFVSTPHPAIAVKWPRVMEDVAWGIVDIVESTIR